MVDCKGNIPGPQYAFGTLTGYENHDFTKNRAPAYSLGLSTKAYSSFSSPGPYYIGNVDRNGKYSTQGWTIESRSMPKDKSIGPGPLSYSPEKSKVYTPAYSLGLKLPSKTTPFGPSPAEYFPQYSSQGGFTIGYKRKDVTKPVGPGPQAAVSTNLYKNRSPSYSLGLKGKPLYGSTIGPGPKYNPGKIGHQTRHAYSFGLKHHPCAPPLITREDNDS